MPLGARVVCSVCAGRRFCPCTLPVGLRESISGQAARRRPRARGDPGLHARTAGEGGIAGEICDGDAYTYSEKDGADSEGEQQKEVARLEAGILHMT